MIAEEAEVVSETVSLSKNIHMFFYFLHLDFKFFGTENFIGHLEAFQFSKSELSDNQSYDRDQNNCN